MANTQQPRENRTARFWTYWGQGWVKLSIPAHCELTAHNSGWTDEGHFSEGATWTHEGDRVVASLGRSETDCDGPHSTWSEHESPLDRLTLHVAKYHLETTGETIRVPDWQRVSAGQRDVFAESMGY